MKKLAEVAINKPSTSKSEYYRKINVVKNNMPNTPTSYARAINQLSTKVSPRKRIAVQSQKPVKRSLGGIFFGIGNLADTSTKENFVLKTGKTAESVMAKYLLAKACRINKLKYSHVGRLGISNNIYSKAKKTGYTGIKQRKGLPDSTKEKVKEYWYTISRPMPLKKRVKKKTPMFLLECSYTTAYKDFMKLHPNIKIGYVMFTKLKPSNVRLLKSKERIVCCCIKCENIKNTIKSLNELTKRVGLGGLRVDNERELSDLTLCAYQNKQFPAKDCIDRKCKTCGVTKLNEYYKPLLDKASTNEVKINKWKNVQETKMIKNVEKKISSVQLVTEYKTLKDTVDDMCAQLILFSSHLFRAKWQQNMFAHIKECTPPKTSIMVLDFAENYACAMQDEVQSHHWALEQVTIHPIVACVNAAETTGPCTNIETDIFISDDRKHDAAAVQVFSELCIEKHKNKFGIRQVIEFTDCCAGQYRGKTAFADISVLSEKVSIQRHYFESSHGKSSADGISAVVKSAATRAVTYRKAVIRNAKEFYDFSNDNLTSVGEGVFPSEIVKYKNSNREFHYIQKEKIQQYRDIPERDLKTVKGTMMLHCVKACKPYEVKVRDSSCFCKSCISEDEVCDNKEFVDDWRTVKLSSTLSDNPCILDKYCIHTFPIHNLIKCIALYCKIKCCTTCIK